MLRTLLLATAVLLASTPQAEARLFRQTYGSTIPGGGQCGCTWNWAQDYFVPRHASSCRYDLFSACKTSRTYSPAAMFCSQIYSGYCTVYSAWRYRWRNHVYRVHCGCEPVRPACDRWRSRKCRRGCDAACTCGGCPAVGCVEGGCGCLPPCCPTGCYPEGCYLPGVEPAGVELLGSIPMDTDDVLVSGALPVASSGGGESLMGIPTTLPADSLPSLESLPSLGAPQTTNSTQ